MKECDILGVKTYSDPSYIFSGESTLRTPGIYALDGHMAFLVAVHYVIFFLEILYASLENKFFFFFFFLLTGRVKANVIISVR